MNETVVRDLLIQFLRGGLAFLPFKDIIQNISVEKINKKIPGVSYTPFHLMEHIRIAQWDILEFVKDQKHISPDWPEGYWPDKSLEADLKDWDKSVKQFFTDLNELEGIVQDENFTLTDLLPEHDSYTFIREFMMVIVHNSYHLGQLVLLSKAD